MRENDLKKNHKILTSAMTSHCYAKTGEHVAVGGVVNYDGVWGVLIGGHRELLNNIGHKYMEYYMVHLLSRHLIHGSDYSNRSYECNNSN